MPLHASRHIALAVLTFFATLPGLATAEQILQAAQGYRTATFVLGSKSNALPTGTRIALFAKTATSAPRDLYIKGTVLGADNDVMFVEIPEDQLARLARIRAEKDVRFRKIQDADAALVAKRHRLSQVNQPVVLAPSMRFVTVRVNIDQDSVMALQPGKIVTLPDAAVVDNVRVVNGNGITRSYKRDITAVYVSAQRVAQGVYDMAFVAHPGDVEHLVSANIRGTLSDIEPTQYGLDALTPKNRQCYTVTRRGSEVRKIPIPCSN